MNVKSVIVTSNVVKHSRFGGNIIRATIRVENQYDNFVKVMKLVLRVFIYLVFIFIVNDNRS